MEAQATQPPIYTVKDFLTHEECDRIIEAGSSWMHRAPVVGKGIGVASDARTSTTCFLDRDKFIDIMSKVSALTSELNTKSPALTLGAHSNPLQKYQWSIWNTHKSGGALHVRLDSGN